MRYKYNFQNSCGIRMPRRLFVPANEFSVDAFPVPVRHIRPTRVPEAPSLPRGIRRGSNQIRPTVNVFVIYANALGRERAAQIEAHLISSVGGSTHLRFAWSSLRLLYFPSLLQLATEALRASDIVLFSTSLGGDLPLGVRAWIAAELVRPNCHQCGLLALVEPEAGRSVLQQPSPTHAFLSAVARSGGIDFISQSPVEAPNENFAKEISTLGPRLVSKDGVRVSRIRAPLVQRDGRKATWPPS